MLRKDGFSGLLALHEVAPEALAWVPAFESGRPKLDEFLKVNAKDQHDDHLGLTSLIFHEDFTGVAGYITLANDSIQLNGFEEGELGLRNRYGLRAFPAVKVCRLAVHQGLHGQGIGKLIMELAIGHIVGSRQISAVRLLVTDAVNEPSVRRFYEKLGFFDSGWANDQAEKAQHGQKSGNKVSQARETIKMLRDIYG